LIYHPDRQQNRIIESLDICSSKFSQLTFDSQLTIDEMLSKYRCLLNEIELISYDLEQFKQNDLSNREIEQRWKDLFDQTNMKIISLEKQFESMKSRENFIEQTTHELDLIDQQIVECKTYGNCQLIIERLEQIERDLPEELKRKRKQKRLLKRIFVLFSFVFRYSTSNTD